MPQTVSRRPLITDVRVRIQFILFGFRESEILAHGFLLLLSIPCRHYYTSDRYLHYDHRRRYKIACFCSVSICLVCVTVKNIGGLGR
jgi:hypothetical protein